ncbi:hypothetical protein [Desulfosporosinus youngiae]|uniref:hypothetical protein n=1 Tax=Desulfosporosinus youngiae TaxID=339862 RepID=UPI0005A63FA4|nr:hypothetical protein [Desulfosporosinus youngiae]
MHGEAVKAHKTVRGDGATGSHQVLPGGLAKSRTGEWGKPRNAEVSGCGRSCPTQAAPFHLLLVPP